ncbi:Fibronectin type III domain-containing protein 5 [Galemys pyrenaicus]|uniref:Fibronectin type III domain-containing protein 5 n=1 Tax=Galemys pyrenaicus TaxID=202257 RepID=A0A8J5ZU29_GALPY|nr:Fibronectin type III domain-containing protein 5 [Galemys pyrenaicus]
MQAARGGAGRPGRGPERQCERPPGARAASPCAVPGRRAGGATMRPRPPRAALRLWLGCVCLALVQAGKGARAGVSAAGTQLSAAGTQLSALTQGASEDTDSPSAPVNVTVRHLKANSAVVSWDVLEDEVVIGFAISQQKKDVRMLRFIQEVNTTTRSCALWDLEEDTEYIVHVQAISIQGQSPASEPVLFKTPREAEKMASKNKGRPVAQSKGLGGPEGEAPTVVGLTEGGVGREGQGSRVAVPTDEVTMKEMGKNQQLRTGEVLIIVVVLFMWAGVIALFCRQYDIIKDNEPNNNKEKTKSASETSTPEHQGGGLLRSKVRAAPAWVAVRGLGTPGSLWTPTAATQGLVWLLPEEPEGHAGQEKTA